MHRIGTIFCLMAFFSAQASAGEETYDIVVYGGTSAGVIAAVQGAKMGNSVLLIAPEEHLGGMTTSGLGLVDLTTPEVIGGLTRHYFHLIWQHYESDTAWKWEKKRPIKGQLMRTYLEEELLWVLEPHVGEKVFGALLLEAKIPVRCKEQLNRNSGVQMEGGRITALEMESGRTFQGKMFIDATYEGDLMAAAHVSYTVGREPNSRYGETLNGIHRHTPYVKYIDPYRVMGIPENGLLSRIYSDTRGEEGEEDNGVEAYCYRMCLTDIPQNRLLIEKPENYREEQYEIVFRALESGVNINNFFKLSLLPNGKTDSNNKGFISTDYVGMSGLYPEADYQTRKLLALAHEKWQRGLIWTLQNHPRVSAKVRDYYAPWGLPKDEFADNNHWPYQLYVREARRMISAVVINEATVLGEVPVPDSIGLASYHIDSHAVKYIVAANGFLGSEGGLFKPVPKPYSISYQAIVPIRQECENLLVPVCLSASHVAYSSIRMEPTYMILGQSAATAASLALQLHLPVQDLPYSVLEKQLLADGQVLTWEKKG